jgi:hypothetical protein
MQFRNKLLELIDELMSLFEDKNKILYRRLINYHHQVKNVIANKDLNEIVINFISNNYVDEKIKRKDCRFLCNTPLEIDIDLLWESCTSENKIIIWKWIDVLIDCIRNETDHFVTHFSAQKKAEFI